MPEDGIVDVIRYGDKAIQIVLPNGMSIYVNSDGQIYGLYSVHQSLSESVLFGTIVQEKGYPVSLRRPPRERPTRA